MNADFNKRFFTDTDKTGRFIVRSLKTGKTYYVEPIDDSQRSADWGDVDPATKKITGHYGEKYIGSVTEEESLITEENGFEKIHRLGVGESPTSYIDRLDKEYQGKLKK